MHLKHMCPKAPEGYVESLQENYGWEGSELPINVDRHEEAGKCPFCKTPFTDKIFKPCSGREVKRLSGSPGNA